MIKIKIMLTKSLLNFIKFQNQMLTKSLLNLKILNSNVDKITTTKSIKFQNQMLAKSLLNFIKLQNQISF